MSRRVNIMPVVGGVVLLLVAAYFGFQAADAFGLRDESGTATVVGKEHRPAGTTYRTDRVGGVTRTLPQATPEMYLLKLQLGGKNTACPVTRDLYESLREGDRVAIIYQQRRLTGLLQVREVTRRTEGR